MNWFQKNFKTIIYVAFLVPIITVAVVSISHVTKWYGLSNPTSWAIYLSVGIEIAALSALAAISAQMGKKVYFPFAIVTLIQFIGNIFFAYQFIDVNSQSFKDWVDMVDPIVSFLGVESGDLVGHKRFLALFSGGMLPIISLSFLHMLVKFEEEEKKKTSSNLDIPLEQLTTIIGKEEAQVEEQRYKPTEEDLEELKRQLQKFEATYEEPREDKIKRLVYSKRDA
jgi:phosphoglycerol transferase MdoB-like AlkP superfamily enzyme